MGDVTTLGPCRFPSPRAGLVSDDEQAPAFIQCRAAQPVAQGHLFEVAGQRDRLFVEPGRFRARCSRNRPISPLSSGADR